jgi:hypothetical protein
MGEVYVKAVPVALGGDANKPVLMDRPPPSRAEIAAWEAENNIRLPQDYVAFLMTHNGGTVYPMHFRHNIADADELLDLEEILAVDILFTWDAFVKDNSATRLGWRADHVAIGYECACGTLALSLRANEFGAVRFWHRNVATWDEEEDGPMPIGTIAPSFRDFIFAALFDDPDGGTPRWSIPRDLQTATKVNF